MKDTDRRSARPNSTTLWGGLDVPQDSMAVADVAQEHGAELTSLGTIGTRHIAMDQLVRKLQSNVKPLGFVYDAGPCGYWLYRSLTHKGYDGWGVAPSLSPQQAGDRVQTDRREAVPLARLRRSGDLPPAAGPQVEAE